MSQEIELKLALSADAPPQLIEHPLLRERKATVITLGNRYYDTPDGALEAARVALRIRQHGAQRLQTLKSAAQSRGGLSSRGEWEWPVDDTSHTDGLDLAGLRDLAHPALAGVDLERLAPVFSTDFERRLWRYRDGETDIEIALDRGRIQAGDAMLPINELELELKAGQARALWTLAEALCGDITSFGHAPLPARPANHSKASRANALRRGMPSPGTIAAADVTLDDAIEAVDHWQDSLDPAWQAAGLARLVALAESSSRHGNDAEEAAARSLADTLASGAVPWRSDLWLALRRGGAGQSAR